MLRLPPQTLKPMWSPPHQMLQQTAKLLSQTLQSLSLLQVHSLIIILSTGLMSRSQSQGFQGSQVLHQHLAPLILTASRQTIHFSIAPRTPIQGKGLYQTGSGAILSAAIIHASYTTKVASSRTSALRLKPLLVCPTLRKPWIASSKWVCCNLLLLKSIGMKSCCFNSMPHFTSEGTAEIRRLGSWSG